VTADDKGFAAEAHLRDFLAGNLDLIEHGLELFTDDNGNAGVEYVIAIGRIDILAIDSDGNFLVVELKVGKGPDDVCGQIMRYVSWVKRHLAKGKKVRGIIIAKSISDKIRYALADLENIEAHEYNMNISLKAVPHIDTKI
jgi:RecB family endonuclease NucS